MGPVTLVLKCIANTLHEVPDEYLDSRTGYTRDRSLPLVVGQRYVVVAVAGWQGGMWLYVMLEPTDSYPHWCPAPLFEVVDPTIPDDWILCIHHYPHGGVAAVMSFPEWAEDPHFYERLVDGDEAVRDTFRRRRAELETSGGL